VELLRAVLHGLLAHWLVRKVEGWWARRR